MGVSPMTLNSKGEESEDPEGEVSTLATAPEEMLEEMLVSPPVGGPAQTTLQVLSPMTLNLGEQMSSPSHATTLDGSDSDAAAFPITTNNLNPTNPTTNTGQNSPKTPTRPPNAAEMPSGFGPPGPPGPAGLRAETSTCPMLPPTRATSSAWLQYPLLRPSHRRVPHVSPALL
jgi:hypothetical protein